MILQNAVRLYNEKTKKEVILNSIHRHDFQEFKIKYKRKEYNYFIDGGLDYVRTGGDLTMDKVPHILIQHLYLDDDNSVKSIKEKLLWGTYQNKKTVIENFKWIKLVDCTTEHLEAILKNVKLTILHSFIIKLILTERLNDENK